MELPDGPLEAMYDDEHRDQIRRELIEYSTQHRIGTPTLQLRIAQASDRTLDEVNNKTLQRFLAGKHRTNDAFVWLCHKFLFGIDVADPVKNFGDAATTFFKGGGISEGQSDILGVFDIDAIWDGGDDVFSKHSQLTLTSMPDRNYMRAEEKVGRGHDADSHNTAFEGVAIYSVNGLAITLRNILTRRQKWHVLYLLPQLPVDEYDGEMIAPALFGGSQNEKSVFRMRMTKKEEQYDR